MPYMRARSQQSGFTLVEVVVVAPIVLLTIGVFVGLLIMITGEVLVTRSTNQLAYNTQNGLAMIEQDIRTSGSLLTANNLTVSSPQGYSNTAAVFDNTVLGQGQSLVINAIATSGGSEDTRPVWLRDAPSSCTEATRVHNQVMTYNIVYFVRDSTLWRRVIMPNGYTTKGCTSPDQRPSCSAIAATPAYPCIVQDSRVLDGVTALTIEYFASASSTAPLTASAIGTANTAKITLNATKTVAGQDATYSGSIRATRAGTLIDYATP